MGRDKATMVVEGRPLVSRSVEALQGAGIDRVVVVGGDGPALASLGFEHVVDDWPGEGPLGGMLTAARHLDVDIAVVLSCDLLALPAHAVTALVDAVAGGADAALARVDGHDQWHAVALGPRAVASMRAAFDDGQRAPRRALADDRLHRIEGMDPTWFHDADRPDDLPTPPDDGAGG